MKKFRVGVVARLKQGDLLDAMTKWGWDQSETARFLGISSSTFGGWINMNDVPKSFTAEMTIKLYEFTGRTPEELFPDFVRTDNFREKTGRKGFMLEIDPDSMLGTREMFKIECPDTMTPDGILEDKELKEKINNSLRRALSPREESILRACIMDDDTLEEVAKVNGLSAGRIAQIKKQALRKLRNYIPLRELG